MSPSISNINLESIFENMNLSIFQFLNNMDQTNLYQKTSTYAIS